MQSFTEKYGNADTPHREKYGRAVSDIGLDNIRNMLPWDKKELVDAYAKDEHFNCLPLKEWDRIAGYYENSRTGELFSHRSLLKDLLYKAGVNYFSCSECVCVLKEAALQIVESAAL